MVSRGTCNDVLRSLDLPDLPNEGGDSLTGSSSITCSRQGPNGLPAARQVGPVAAWTHLEDGLRETVAYLKGV